MIDSILFSVGGLLLIQYAFAFMCFYDRDSSMSKKQFKYLFTPFGWIGYFIDHTKEKYNRLRDE